MSSATMASSLAHLLSLGFHSRPFVRHLQPAAASIARSFSSRAKSQDNNGDDYSLDDDRHSDRTRCRSDDSFSDPFSPFRMNLMMDLFTEKPFRSASRSDHRGWDAKDADDALTNKSDGSRGGDDLPGQD